MALPDGVTTCTATFGAAGTYGGAVSSITGKLTADRDIVWDATGESVSSGDDEYFAASGQTLQVPVPHVDQTGFIVPGSGPVTGWNYNLSGTITYATGKTKKYSKNFQVFVGQATKDLDRVPDDATVLPATVVVDPPVTSVAGLTGAVSAEDLGDALSATFARVVDGELVGPDGEPISVGLNLTVLDEDTEVSTDVTSIDFQGPGVTAGGTPGEIVVTVGDVGAYDVTTASSGAGTYTIPSVAAVNLTITGNVTLAFTTPTTTGHTVMLRVAGAFTLSFPASVKWADASAPTYASPSVYVFTTLDGGTTWLGSQVGKAFA